MCWATNCTNDHLCVSDSARDKPLLGVLWEVNEFEYRKQEQQQPAMDNNNAITVLSHNRVYYIYQYCGFELESGEHQKHAFKVNMRSIRSHGVLLWPYLASNLNHESWFQTQKNKPEFFLLSSSHPNLALSNIYIYIYMSRNLRH